MLHGFLSRVADHTFLFKWTWAFLSNYMDFDLNVFLRAVFVTWQDGTTGFLPAKSNVVDTHSVTLHKDVSSILKLLDGFLATLALEPSVTMSFGPLGLGAAPPQL